MTGRSLALALARTDLGRRALAAIAAEEPRLAIEALGPALRRPVPFDEAVPDRVEGFEDVVFLFASNQLNRGVASLDLDEAAYLWRLVHELPPTTLVEIGRYRGGSTFLLAAAMHPESRLVSYDLHVKGGGEAAGAERDEELLRSLRRSGLADRVELVVGDSATARQPDSPCGLVFVDGDHSYEGVRADYLRWRPKLPAGGHMVFHDARAFRELATRDPDTARLVGEVARADAELFDDLGGAGSLAHFRRTAAPLPES